MGILSLCLVLLAAPLGPASQGPTDLPGALSALGGASAEQRFVGERWLVANLGSVSGQELLAALGEQPDEEVLWRLGRALGDARGGLDLALELAVGDLAPETPLQLELDGLFGPEPETGWAFGRRVGDLALDQAIAGWRAGLDRLPVVGEELELLLREERERSGWVHLRHRPTGLAESVDALNRRADLPAPLVLAPELARRLVRERFQPGGGPDRADLEPVEGPWDVVLLEVARRSGAVLEAVLEERDGRDELAWLRLVPRGEEGRRAGREQLREALTDLARGELRQVDGEEVLSPAVHMQLAARFLAGVGWQAALGWLGDRWWEQRDPAALAGLLEAAGRGRFEPRLLSPEGVERLLDEGRRLERLRGDVELLALRLERALARLPRQLPGGPTAPLLLDGWRDEGDLVRHLRLAGLVGVGGGGEAGADLARAVLAGSAGGDTQWQALGILGQVAGAGAKPLVLGAPEALLELVPDRAHPDELARLLGRAGVAPPRAAALERGSPAGLRAVLLATILVGDPLGAAELLVGPLDLSAPGSWERSLQGTTGTRLVDELAAGLEGLVRGGELLGVRAVLGLAERQVAAAEREPDPGVLASGRGLTALDRLSLLAGAMPPERQAQLVEQVQAAGPASALYQDNAALACLGASPAGAPVRRLLLERLDVAFASPRPRDGAELLPALEHCLALLWARNDDGVAEELVLEVTRVAASHARSEHPLVLRVLYRRWPPPPRGLVRDLDLLTTP